MYSRYDPTAHDTFLPVGRETKTIEFPAPLPDEQEQARLNVSDSEISAGADAMHGTTPSMVGSDTAASAAGAAVTAGAMQGAAAAAPRKGLLDGLRGLFGGSSSRGLLGNLDLGDIILLLIVALLFLEGGSESDLIILLAVALFIGF